MNLKYKLNNEPRWIPLSSSRKKAVVTGEIQVKTGLVDPASPNSTKEELQIIWDKFIGSLGTEDSGLQAVINAPPTESVGIGMIRADSFGPEAQSADDLDEEMSPSDTEDLAGKKKRRGRIRGLPRKNTQPFEFVQGVHDVMGVIFMEVQGAKDLPPERNGSILIGEY